MIPVSENCFGGRSVPFLRGNVRIEGGVILAVLLAALLASCAVCDLRTGRIPNRLLFSGLSAVFLIGIPLDAEDGFSACLLAARGIGRALGFLLLFLPVFRLRLLGAGDLKLFALIFLALGFSRGLAVIFCGLLPAAVCSLFVLRRRYSVFSPGGRERIAIPLAPWLAAGFALAQILENTGILQEVTGY
jgi:Flp pilus assembly protein protease CpaA